MVDKCWIYVLLTAETGPYADAGQQPGLSSVPGCCGHQKRLRRGLSFDIYHLYLVRIKASIFV